MVPHFVLFDHEVKTKRGAGLVLNLACAWNTYPRIRKDPGWQLSLQVCWHLKTASRIQITASSSLFLSWKALWNLYKCIILGESWWSFPGSDSVGWFWALNNFIVPTDMQRPLFLLWCHYTIADLLTLELILTWIIQGVFALSPIAKAVVYPNPLQF